MLVANNRKIDFTSSTCSVVNGPPYLNFPRSIILEGMSSSHAVCESTAIEGSFVLGSKLENLVNGCRWVRLDNQPAFSEKKVKNKNETNKYSRTQTIKLGNTHGVSN